MTKKVDGCVHLIVKNGKIVNAITHLSELPQDGIVHLKGDKIYTVDEFKASHVHDHAELDIKEEGIIISDF